MASCADGRGKDGRCVALPTANLEDGVTFLDTPRLLQLETVLDLDVVGTRAALSVDVALGDKRRVGESGSGSSGRGGGDERHCLEGMEEEKEEELDHALLIQIGSCRVFIARRDS